MTVGCASRQGTSNRCCRDNGSLSGRASDLVTVGVVADKERQAQVPALIILDLWQKALVNLSFHVTEMTLIFRADVSCQTPFIAVIHIAHVLLRDTTAVTTPSTRLGASAAAPAPNLQFFP